MKFAEKEFSYYWKIIRIPLVILVAWSLIGFVIALVNYNLYTQIFSNISGWILTVAIFGFIGYHTTKDHAGETKHGFYAGLITGIIYGFIGAIIGIIMINLIPDFTAAALAQASTQGVDAATLEKFIKIGAYIGVIIGPLFSGVIGAIISWIGGLLGKRV